MLSTQRRLVLSVVACVSAQSGFAQSPREIAPIFPTDRAENVSPVSTFQFPAVPAGEFCELRVSEQTSLEGPIRLRRIPEGSSSLDMRGDLELGKTYYWQLSCRASAGLQPTTARSPLLSFKTGNDRKLALLAPRNATEDVPVTDDVRFTWERFPGADSYRLVIAAQAPGQSAADKSSIQIDDSSQVNPKSPEDPPYAFLKLKPGVSYQWHVEATSDKAQIATSEKQSFKTKARPFAEASSAGFALQRALTLGDSKDQTDPATFGFSAQSGGSPYFNTEFALIWKSRDFCDSTESWCASSVNLVRAEASVEGRLNSSGSEKQNDVFKARAGAYVNVDHGEQGFSTFFGTYKYETDRKANTKKQMLEVLYTPTLPPYIGMTLPRDKNDYTGRTREGVPFEYSWRPYFGVDVGRTQDVGSSLEDESSLLRAVVRLSAHVRFLQLARILGLPKVTLFIDDYNRYLFRTTNRRNNNFFQAGMDFFISDNVSIALRGNIGRDAPDFTFSRDVSINLGVGF